MREAVRRAWLREIGIWVLAYGLGALIGLALGMVWPLVALAAPPSVAGTAEVTVNATKAFTRPILMPTGVVAGEYLVVVGGVNKAAYAGKDIGVGDGTPCDFIGGPGADWQPVSDTLYGPVTEDDVMVRAFYKLADGTESGTSVDFCWDTPVIEKSVFVAFRVTGAGTLVHRHATANGFDNPGTTPSVVTTAYETLVIRYGGADNRPVSGNPGGTEVGRGLAGGANAVGAGAWAEEYTAPGTIPTGTITMQPDDWTVATWAIASVATPQPNPCLPPVYGISNPTPYLDIPAMLASEPELVPGATRDDWQRSMDLMRVHDAWRSGFTGKGVIVGFTGNTQPLDARAKEMLWNNPAEDLDADGVCEVGATPGGDEDDLDNDGDGCIDNVCGCSFLFKADPNDVANCGVLNQPPCDHLRVRAGVVDIGVDGFPGAFGGTDSGHDIQAIEIGFGHVDSLGTVGFAPEAKVMFLGGLGQASVAPGTGWNPFQPEVLDYLAIYGIKYTAAVGVPSSAKMALWQSRNNFTNDPGEIVSILCRELESNSAYDADPALFNDPNRAAPAVWTAWEALSGGRHLDWWKRFGMSIHPGPDQWPTCSRKGMSVVPIRNLEAAGSWIAGNYSGTPLCYACDLEQDATCGYPTCPAWKNQHNYTDLIPVGRAAQTPFHQNVTPAWPSKFPPLDFAVVSENGTYTTSAQASWSNGALGGIWALTQEAWPDYTADQIRERLCRTASQHDAGTYPYDQPHPFYPGVMVSGMYGCGLLDAFQATNAVVPEIDGGSPELPEPIPSTLDTHPVSISFWGVLNEGLGRVVSTPAGIDCHTNDPNFTACTELFPRSVATVLLTATPDPNHTFKRWEGGAGCESTQNPVNLSIGTGLGCMARFYPPTFSITVTIIGSGSVVSSPAGISCPGDCTEAFTPETALTLTATPDPNEVFDKWTQGPCLGTNPILNWIVDRKPVVCFADFIP